MENSPQTPSEEGKKRYPHTDGFYLPYAPDQEFKEPCTCIPVCKNPCSGQYGLNCKCEACTSAYGDALEAQEYE